MMSTSIRTFFQSGVQKNLKSLCQSFVLQKFASAHVCVQTDITGETSFSSSIQTRFDCVVNHCVQRAP